MSGIAGVFDRRGNGSPPDIASTLARALSHRAPDGWREETLGPATFVHLGTVVGSRDRNEQLPGSASGDILITCDARLYNRESLGKRLGVPADKLNGLPDSELILRAYRLWGEQCARCFEGDFAVVIFDRRRRSVLLARDFLGARPLYYALDRERLIFASEARGVIAAMPATPPLDRLRMVDYLCNMESADAHRSFHEGVSRLPPGTTLVVTANQASERRYWAASDVARDPVDIGHDEAAAQLATLLADACRSRTEALDAPAALSLSGGIDSAMVAAFSDCVAISAVSTDTACADTDASRRVRAHLGLEGIEVSVADAADEDTALSERLARLDDPFSSIQLITLLLFLRARAGGHRVLLDGIEGDLVYSLPGQLLPTLIRRRQWRAVGQELFAYPPTPPLSAAKLIARSSLPGSILRRRAEQRAKVAVEASVLAPALKADDEIRARIGNWVHQQEHLFATPAELHAAWIDRPFITSALERYERIAALCGVEIRHPLLAKPLVEFALRLPWQHKMQARQTKRVLRDAGLAQTTLPRDILKRTDRPHLGWSFCEDWMQRHWHEIRVAVERNRDLWQPWVDTSRLDDAFRAPAFEPATHALDTWYWYHWITWLERTHNPSAGRPDE